MAAAQHLELASFIKTVHQTLREETKTLGFEEAWKNHCDNKNNLKQYAECMHDLATNYWQENYNKKESKAISRVKWVYDICKLYFFENEILKCRQKEEKILIKIGLSVEVIVNYFNCKLKLLDVGSCYNPFKDYNCFDVVPIDIAPATKDVFKCDFLNLHVTDMLQLQINGTEIYELPKDCFDVVVFSLLLEYLPTSEQRYLCCKKAYRLLKVEGLLVIITPDSKHVGANAKYMKSWRYILASLGFSRIKYEKLPHLHCMAFRKAFKPEITRRWCNLHTNNDLFDKLYIPQDFYKLSVKNEEKSTCISNISFLSELPNFEEN